MERKKGRSSHRMDANREPRRTDDPLPDDFYDDWPEDLDPPEQDPDNLIHWQEPPPQGQAPGPCCVSAFSATVVPLRAADRHPRYPRFFLRRARRRIRFSVTMGRPADARRVQVIQYVKRPRHVHPSGVGIQPQKTGPNNQPWAWTPGLDDWIVDSADDIRCWPDRGPGQPMGLRRNAVTGNVTWYVDAEPRPGLQFYTRQIDSGIFAKTDFPIFFSMQYKTDVLCSPTNLCVRESPAARRRLEPLWSSAVVATVVWSFSSVVRAASYAPDNRLKPYVSIASLTVSRSDTTIFKRCPPQQH